MKERLFSLMPLSWKAKRIGVLNVYQVPGGDVLEREEALLIETAYASGPEPLLELAERYARSFQTVLAEAKEIKEPETLLDKSAEAKRTGNIGKFCVSSAKELLENYAGEDRDSLVGRAVRAGLTLAAEPPLFAVSAYDGG
jgi:hypothetical protein